MLLEKLLPLNRKDHEKQGSSYMNVLYFFFFLGFLLFSVQFGCQLYSSVGSPNDDSD